jgi:hypothetical protein
LWDPLVTCSSWHGITSIISPRRDRRRALPRRAWQLPAIPPRPARRIFLVAA